MGVDQGLVDCSSNRSERGWDFDPQRRGVKLANEGLATEAVRGPLMVQAIVGDREAAGQLTRRGDHPAEES